MSIYRVNFGEQFVTIVDSGGAQTTARVLERNHDESGRLVEVLLDRVVHAPARSYDQPIYRDHEHEVWSPSGAFATSFTRHSYSYAQTYQDEQDEDSDDNEQAEQGYYDEQNEEGN